MKSGLKLFGSPLASARKNLSECGSLESHLTRLETAPVVIILCSAGCPVIVNGKMSHTRSQSPLKRELGKGIASLFLIVHFTYLDGMKIPCFVLMSLLANRRAGQVMICHFYYSKIKVLCD